MADLLTWKVNDQYNSHSGSAGGIRLFGITWKSRRSDPNWLMRCDLPGLQGKEWKDDDRDVLKAEAEKVLASWLAQVTGDKGTGEGNG